MALLFLGLGGRDRQPQLLAQGAGQEPTEAQRRANRKALSEALGVSPDRLDEVLDKYRPGGRGTNH